MNRALLLLALLLAFAACRRERMATPAFYYWKTRYQGTPQTRQAFAALKARKLYLRLCDIGYDPVGRQILPQDVLRMADPPPPGAEIVPVLFMEQPALRNLSAHTDLEALAQNIAHFTGRYCAQQGWAVREVQLDCDWTAKTAESYFSLLRALKQTPFLKGKTLSVTLRGHQAKYPAKAGIPPADRCMLMCYNMGNINNLQGESSILEVPVARDYLQNLSAYPLPVDVALPVFRWTLWYRNSQFLGILRGIDPEDLSRHSFLIKKKKANLYSCRTDTVLAGYRLQAGDLLKAESPRPEEVAAVAAYAAQRLPPSPFTVAFYHLDDQNLMYYDVSKLEEILRRCH